MDDTIDATLPIVANTLSARFIDSCKYLRETGCWEWIGFWRKSSKSPSFRVWGRERSARRMSWELFRGYHLHANCRIVLTCDNPRCVCPGI